jgi:hypothetical protein
VKGDWDAWNARPLGEGRIVRHLRRQGCPRQPRPTRDVALASGSVRRARGGPEFAAGGALLNDGTRGRPTDSCAQEVGPESMPRFGTASFGTAKRGYFDQKVA